MLSWYQKVNELTSANLSLNECNGNVKEIENFYKNIVLAKIWIQYALYDNTFELVCYNFWYKNESTSKHCLMVW